jgi:hypothetical protein
MYPLPTLYKARNLPLKRPVCAICMDRTRGRTEDVRLGYHVTVWLCPATPHKRSRPRAAAETSSAR